MNKNYSAVLEKSIFLNILKQISLVLILGVALIVQAAPGDLDTTFNGTGKSRVGFGLGDDFGSSVAVQADGKMVVAGSSQNGSGTRYDFSAARYNTDGSLDTLFGVGGKVLTPVGLSGLAAAVRIQTDGKIVVAGYAASSADIDFAVVRYNSDGSLDASFGGDGIVITPVGTDSNDEGNALIIQSDGKVIVAGHTNFNFAIVRYTTNGLLDTTFGSGGKVITDFGNRADANAATIQPDGKIVVAGDFNAMSGSQVVIARYNTNGSPDTTFDSDGKVFTSGSAGNSYGNAVAIQLGTATIPDKIVVAGYSSGDYKIAVYRYNLNGSPDTTFDGDGEVLTKIPNVLFAGASDLRIQGSGNQPRKIIVVTSSGFFISGNEIAVVRYNSDGSLDNSFSGDGIAFAPFGTSTDGSALVLAAGKIVVAGSSLISPDNRDFAIARFNTDGSLDTTFDEDGKRTDNVGNLEAIAKSAAIQTDNKIVVAGYALGNSNGTNNKDFAVTRYNTDGSLDNSFSVDGKVTTAIGTSDDQANAVAIQADGRIVVAGSNFNGTVTAFAVVRYNSNGSPDTSFDTDGIVISAIGANSVANAIAIQSDGKIVVAGSSNNDFAVVRYLANGSPDSSFGSNNNGIVITGIGSVDTAATVKIQSDGKIVVAGSAFSANQDIAVVRYLANGTLDPNFGSLGKVTTDINESIDTGLGMAIQSDGKIVVAGNTVSNSNSEVAAVRYLANGSLDNSFDVDGKVITPIGFANDSGVAAAIEPGGKILVAGYSEIGNNTEFAVVRYNPTGALDNSYGSFGKTIADVSNGGNDFGNAMALDSSGRAVVAGEANGLFGVVRILGDFAPTAAQVSISGRVLTPTGRGLTNAVVLITDMGGNTRTARTTTFGYFRFEEVEAGQTYIFSVRSKRYRFAPQVVTVTEELDKLNFTAERGAKIEERIIYKTFFLIPPDIFLNPESFAYLAESSKRGNQAQPIAVVTETSSNRLTTFSSKTGK